MKRIVVSGAVICSLFLILIPGAGASDGVLEINQACAVNTGCFTGDDPGFPVEIVGSVGRSYRLTSDLVLPSPSISGIVIAVPSVSIDLNGFEIVTEECLGAITNCTPTVGNGDGIAFTGPGDGRGISVKNGTITGMGDDGVKLGMQAEIVNLRLRWNGERGINADDQSIVTGNTAYENGDIGIYAESGSTITGNGAFKNGNGGIKTVNGSTVMGNTVYQNGAYGIFANFGSTVSGNSVNENDGDGISTHAGSMVSGNTVRGNTKWGLDLSATSTYSQNTVTENTDGAVDGGVNMGGNSCNGAPTCP